MSPRPLAVTTSSPSCPSTPTPALPPGLPHPRDDHCPLRHGASPGTRSRTPLPERLIRPRPGPLFSTCTDSPPQVWPPSPQPPPQAFQPPLPPLLQLAPHAALGGLLHPEQDLFLLFSKPSDVGEKGISQNSPRTTPPPAPSSSALPLWVGESAAEVFSTLHNPPPCPGSPPDGWNLLMFGDHVRQKARRQE